MVLVPTTIKMRSLVLGLSRTLIVIVLFSTGSVNGMEPGAALVSSADTGSDDGDEIKSMIVKYVKSVDEANTTLASQIWSNSPEVSFIHPLGHEHGLEQIEQNIYTHLMGETFSERKLSIRDISAHVHGETAWAEFYWDFSAKLRKDGSSITTHGRETQVYWKEGGRWRLVHVHYSGMPVSEARKGF